MQVKYHKNFLKKYSTLSSELQKKVDMRIVLFTKNQWQAQLNNHLLQGRYQSYRSINITGDIRTIYKEIPEGVYSFIDIDNHSNLYG